MQQSISNNKKNNNQTRQLLAKEAARLMYEEGVSQYIDAKKMAAKRLFGKAGQKRIRYHPKDLPSNGEISIEVAKLVDLLEDNLDHQLFAMRSLAIDIMTDLAPFKPRLIGSVSTGRIRKDSDIDLHLFTDEIEILEQYLVDLGWQYEKKQVVIQQNAHFIEYTHLYIQLDFPIELSVYPLNGLRIRGRSSTDGKPINRLNKADVKKLLTA